MNKALLFILCLFGFIAGVYAEEITVSFDINLSDSDWSGPATESFWYTIGLSSTTNNNILTRTLTFHDSGDNVTYLFKSKSSGKYINISHPSDDTFIVSTNKITQITIDGQTVQIIADEQDNVIKLKDGKWINTRLENKPARAPIPPIAIALILITIPIIALRKLN
jgi:hypothetical protein